MKKFILILDKKANEYALLTEMQEEEFCNRICYEMNTSQNKFRFIQLEYKHLEAFKKHVKITKRLKSLKEIGLQN
jgi:hypothetical protein